MKEKKKHDDKKNTNTENDCKTYKKLKTEKTEQSAVVREKKTVC